MPNWCNNRLTVRGPAEDVWRLKETAVGHSPWLTPEQAAAEQPSPLNFHSLFPVPEALVNGAYNDMANQWEKAHWGCRWGACETRILDEGDGYLIYEFDTAWVPPLEFIEHVSHQWPTLNFLIEYEEMGMGFKGLAKAEDGKLDDYSVTY